MAGSPTTSTASVKRAAKMTQPGKATGPDGLPAELWSSFQLELAPMLASLYTAIGTTGQSSPGYLDGVIRCLPKPGDAADQANYRPITLLNTDYRLMGKVLAARLAPLLSCSIPPEQTAFLPGRLIGDNLAMLQLLPAWLRLCGEQHGLPATATLACLDFRKAYDTVSRPFLLAVMKAVGAGPGLIGWAKTVLLDTRAAAMVNGFTSASYRSHAGVRQGCPLAPVLYMFIAWALNAWLCTCPVVGLVPAGWEGRRLLGDQYADDTHVLLRSRSPEDVQCFLRHMAVFACASGQHLNEKKSVLVPVGSARPIGEPVLIQGLKVSGTVTALGGPLWSGGPGGGSRPTNEAALLDDPTWGAPLGVLRAALTRASTADLSAFGRATASHTYGMSKLLHLAEHFDPPHVVLSVAHSWARWLVDADILRVLCPHVPPVLALLSATQPGADPEAGRLAPCLHLPSAHDLPACPLRRMEVGLCALGEIEPMRPLHFARAPMWQYLPLWGNPHLHIDRPSGSRPEGWPVPLTVAPAPPSPRQVIIAHMIADSQSGAIAEVVATGLCPAALGGATTLGTTVAARTGISVQAGLMLMAAIPELCRAGAMAGGEDAAADARDATREVVDSLGWRAPADGMSAPISLADHPALRVGRVTRQLLAPSRRMRAGWQGEFVDSAFEGDAAGPADAAERVVEVAALARAMKGLWRVLWVNQSKETYWRLAAHGVRYAGVGRMHLP
ncbi:hypothetical protein FOA52_015765 [Chlamydomonas sp. UWO 241]|nr:hypothetical protein FOA52_015765 [Chlamydomonas sp. UWO 241]